MRASDQRGFTLVEVLVASALAVFVFGAVAAFFGLFQAQMTNAGYINVPDASTGDLLSVAIAPSETASAKAKAILLQIENEAIMASFVMVAPGYVQDGWIGQNGYVPAVSQARASAISTPDAFKTQLATPIGRDGGALPADSIVPFSSTLGYTLFVFDSSMRLISLTRVGIDDRTVGGAQYRVYDVTHCRIDGTPPMDYRFAETISATQSLPSYAFAIRGSSGVITFTLPDPAKNIFAIYTSLDARVSDSTERAAAHACIYIGSQLSYDISTIP